MATIVANERFVTHDTDKLARKFVAAANARRREARTPSLKQSGELRRISKENSAAMAKAGYRVTGLDMSADMVAATRTHMADHGVEAPLIQAAFADVPAAVGPFDGVFCLGNSLAATGSAAEAERSVAALASVLAPGGRLFVQILNFEKLRAQRPRAR